jgi:hypothetical protein
VAGVHFPCDSAAGAILGCSIGDAVYALATNKTITSDRNVFKSGMDYADGNGDTQNKDVNFTDDLDFNLNWLGSKLKQLKLEDGDENPLLAKSWALAAAEWP